MHEEPHNPESSRPQQPVNNELINDLIKIRDQAAAERAGQSQAPLDHESPAIETPPAEQNKRQAESAPPDPAADQELEKRAEQATLREVFDQVNRGIGELTRQFSIDEQMTEQMQQQFSFLTRQVEGSMKSQSGVELSAIDFANSLRNEVRHFADQVEAEDARARVELNQLRDALANELAKFSQTDTEVTPENAAKDIASLLDSGFQRLTLSRGKVLELYRQFAQSLARKQEMVQAQMARFENESSLQDSAGVTLSRSLRPLSGGVLAQNQDLRTSTEAGLGRGRESFAKASQVLQSLK